MEDKMLISSSPSSPTNNTLQQKLQQLLQTQLTQCWNYTIFWTTCPERDNFNPTSLIWADGHFNSFKPDKSITYPNTEPILIDDDHDIEWYYMTSPSRSHSIHGGGNGGIVAKCFTTASVVWLTGEQMLRLSYCHRAKEAHSHGLQTIACIPVFNGVVEIGSLDLIHENWGLVQLAHSLFGPPFGRQTTSISGN